jgi:xylulokinase
LIEALEIPRDWLPQVTESPVASAKVSVAGASATGLLEGTPVIAGAGDQAAEAVGSGIIAPALGIVSVTVGTSGVVFAAMGDYRIDPTGGMHAFCHALPGMWHVMGVMLSAGGSLRWFRDVLGGGATYEQIIDSARTVPAGCEGLVFLPYLSGERTPHADPNARGAFVGLTLRHTKAHLARAVLEGVTFGLRNALDLARHMGVGIERIRVSGGGARSAFWKQMMADVFAVPVASPQVVEGAAYGAAILAAVGAWGYPGVREAVAAMVNEGDEVRPGSRTGAYEEVYGLYNGLYPALKPHFEAVATEAGAMS